MLYNTTKPVFLVISCLSNSVQCGTLISACGCRIEIKLLTASTGNTFTVFIEMSGWLLLASAIVQYQRKIKLLNLKKKISLRLFDYFSRTRNLCSSFCYLLMLFLCRGDFSFGEYFYQYLWQKSLGKESYSKKT